MIAETIFVIISILLVSGLKRINQVRSDRYIFAFKYIIMAMVGYQYYSIFIYGGVTKGGYAAEDILFFQDILVSQLQLPGYIQFFALAICLYICLFCHPKHKNS